LFGRVVCALFDSGASHSFISSSYVKLCRVSTEPLEQNICVATPVGYVVTCKKYVSNCHIVIKGRVLPAKISGIWHDGLRCHSGNGLAIEV
jgi:hypothetical protein